MMRKDVQTISLAVLFGFCIFLSACSDNKSQDTQSTPKTASQTGSGQSAESQSQPLATPPSSEQGSPADGGKCNTLLTAKCTVCHSTSRICEKLGKKSKARWQRTISRMTDRGAKVNIEEAAALLICLDSGAKNLEPSCR